MKKIQESVAIENNVNLLLWVVNELPFEDQHLLNRNNKFYFKIIFGKQYTVMNLEYRNWIWVVNFKSCSFNLFCSFRGTSCELIGEREDLFSKENEIKEFILFVIIKLKEIING